MISDYKEYTLSQEFLVNQYKPEFVDSLNTSLKQEIQEGFASKILEKMIHTPVWYLECPVRRSFPSYSWSAYLI